MDKPKTFTSAKNAQSALNGLRDRVEEFSNNLRSVKNDEFQISEMICNFENSHANPVMRFETGASRFTGPKVHLLHWKWYVDGWKISEIMQTGDIVMLKKPVSMSKPPVPQPKEAGRSALPELLGVLLFGKDGD